MAMAKIRVERQDDPQVVIERLAKKRVSEEDAGKYFTEKIERNQGKSVQTLIVDAVKQAFRASR